MCVEENWRFLYFFQFFISLFLYYFLLLLFSGHDQLWFSTTSSLVALSDFSLFIILLCPLFCHFFSQTQIGFLFLLPSIFYYYPIEKIPYLCFLTFKNKEKMIKKTWCCNLQGPKSEASSENQTHNSVIMTNQIIVLVIAPYRYTLYLLSLA